MGSPATRRSNRRPGLGYMVRIQGQGLHAVRLRFNTAVNSSGTERDLRFGIPDVPLSRLQLRLPPAARHVNAAGAHRGQKVIGAEKGLRLEADFGQSTLASIRSAQTKA